MPLSPDELKQLAPALSPHGIYVEGDDYLLVTTINAAAGVVVTIGGRMVMPTGRPQPFRDRHVANTDRTAATSVIRLGEGWLQEVTAIVSTGTPMLGQTFARVDLVRGDGAGRNVHATLLQGPITAFHRAAWPGSPVQTTLGLPGALRSITGTDPAAGAELAETVPTGARWRFISLRVSLTTDANAANRVPQLIFDDGTNVFAGAAGNFNQTAGATFVYHFVAAGVSHAQSSVSVQVATPANLLIPAGGRIRSSTGGIQVGDNFTAPQYLVEEWLEG